MTFASDFRETEAALESVLAEPAFREAFRRLQSGGMPAEALMDLVDRNARGDFPESEWARMEALCGTEDPLLLPRAVLLAAAERNIGSVRSVPYAEEVKGRLLEFFRYICAPDRETDTLLKPGHYGFRAMCRMVTLRRFPAGQIDLEMGGVPRSWLWKVRRVDAARFAWTVWGKAGGKQPFFQSHTAYRRELPIITRQAEEHAVRLMALTLEMQPAVRGLSSASWFLDPQLRTVSPHLGWLADWLAVTKRYGAFISSIGPAPPGMGYLQGDRRRRRLYETGQWKPLLGVSVWPREGILRWLRENG